MQSGTAAVRKGCLPLLNATTPPKRLFSYSLLLFSSSCARSKGLLTVASSRFCPLLVPLIFDMSWYHPFTECPSAPSVEGGAGLHLESFWVPLNLPTIFRRKTNSMIHGGKTDKLESITMKNTCFLNSLLRDSNGKPQAGKITYK